MTDKKTEIEPRKKRVRNGLFLLFVIAMVALCVAGGMEGTASYVVGWPALCAAVLSALLLCGLGAANGALRRMRFTMMEAADHVPHPDHAAQAQARGLRDLGRDS